MVPLARLGLHPQAIANDDKTKELRHEILGAMSRTKFGALNSISSTTTATTIQNQVFHLPKYIYSVYETI
jgi:hypothetical protein